MVCILLSIALFGVSSWTMDCIDKVVTYETVPFIRIKRSVHVKATSGSHRMKFWIRFSRPQ